MHAKKQNEPRALEKLKTLPPRPSDHDTVVYFFEGKILTVRVSGNPVKKCIDEWLPTFKFYILAAWVRSGANIYFPSSILWILFKWGTDEQTKEINDAMMRMICPKSKL